MDNPCKEIPLESEGYAVCWLEGLISVGYAYGVSLSQALDVAHMKHVRCRNSGRGGSIEILRVPAHETMLNFPLDRPTEEFNFGAAAYNLI